MSLIGSFQDWIARPWNQVKIYQECILATYIVVKYYLRNLKCFQLTKQANLGELLQGQDSAARFAHMVSWSSSLAVRYTTWLPGSDLRDTNVAPDSHLCGLADSHLLHGPDFRLRTLLGILRAPGGPGGPAAAFAAFTAFPAFVKGKTLVFLMVWLDYTIIRIRFGAESAPIYSIFGM